MFWLLNWPAKCAIIFNLGDNCVFVLISQHWHGCLLWKPLETTSPFNTINPTSVPESKIDVNVSYVQWCSCSGSLIYHVVILLLFMKTVTYSFAIRDVCGRETYWCFLMFVCLHLELSCLAGVQEIFCVEYELSCIVMYFIMSPAWTCNWLLIIYFKWKHFLVATPFLSRTVLKCNKVIHCSCTLLLFVYYIFSILYNGYISTLLSHLF